LETRLLELGIVNKVSAAGELMKDVEATATEIMQKGPLAVSIAKQVINEGADLDLVSGLAMERAAFPLIFATEDKTEGVKAFLEKRKAAKLAKAAYQAERGGVLTALRAEAHSRRSSALSQLAIEYQAKAAGLRSRFKGNELLDALAALYREQKASA